MANEVKLEPGWLIKDVRKASERLDDRGVLASSRSLNHTVTGHREGQASKAGEQHSGRPPESRKAVG